MIVLSHWSTMPEVLAFEIFTKWPSKQLFSHSIDG